jgi:hypothetical protein
MTGSKGEPDVVSALRRLAQDVDVPAHDPEAERALLAAFDAAWERNRIRTTVRRPRVRPAATAALLALAATIAFVMVYRPARVSTPAPSPPLAMTDFVVWPGAGELPAFESGHLLRMEMPASALPSLGLVPPSSQAAVVHADVLVGQDGFPRAVRLSPDF